MLVSSWRWMIHPPFLETKDPHTEVYPGPFYPGVKRDQTNDPSLNLDIRRKEVFLPTSLRLWKPRVLYWIPQGDSGEKGQTISPGHSP